MTRGQSDHTGPAADSPGAGDPGRSSKLLPELATLAMLLGLWLGLTPEWLAIPVEEAVVWLVAIEAATLVFMVMLVDIATRLSAPPPWWLGLVLAGGLLIVSPDVLDMLVAGWQLGLWVFLPLAWSLLERLRELWTMPKASRLEKMRRRALSWGRLGTGMILLGLYVASLLGSAILLDQQFEPEAVFNLLALPMLSLFYLIAACDVWRVHRPGFTVRPCSLWPFLDVGDTANIG